MLIEIDAEVRLLAASLLLGMALALVYDLLRALRLRRRGRAWFTDALDALYCAAMALSGFVFALRIGDGELRLYTVAVAALGAALFFAVFSPLLRPLWDFWARTFFELLRLLKIPIKTIKNFYRNLHKIARRLFLFSRKSFIIGTIRWDARRARHIAGRGEGIRNGGKGENARRSVRGAGRPRTAASGGHAADEYARQARRGPFGADLAVRARRTAGAGEPHAGGRA
ncbi:MAG: hypothetical protein E7474_01000 [Ruminococcaceae bacterium]|nr:hypothetical protein [Oscillospiraceae bacterium]